jgi:hypothetical protein
MSRNLLDLKGRRRLGAGGGSNAGGGWSLTLEGRAHWDPVDRLGFPRRLWFDPRQAYIEGKAGLVDVKLGLQQVVWGQADGLRILDVVNPLDYREFILEDFLDSRRPLWMARGDLPLGEGTLQLLWIPYFAPGRQPGAEKEYGLGPIYGLGLLQSGVGQDATPISPFEIGETERPATTIGNSQVGLQYRRSFGQWDLTANYFRGWEDLPTPFFRFGAPGNLRFEPRYPRREVVGGTAATSRGPVVLRMEAGWSRRRPVASSPLLVADSFSQNGFRLATQFSGVFGLDYSARSWLWISGQYFLQQTFGEQRQLLQPRTGHLLSLYWRAQFFRERLRPELFLLVGLHERQSMIRPRWTWLMGDHFSISVGADLLAGKPSTLLGAFAGRDRLVLETRWSW